MRLGLLAVLLAWLGSASGQTVYGVRSWTTVEPWASEIVRFDGAEATIVAALPGYSTLAAFDPVGQRLYLRESGQEHLLVFDLHDSTLTATPVPAGFGATFAYGAGGWLFMADGSNLWALDPATGESRWSAPLPQPLRIAATGSDFIYLSSTDGTLFSFDRATSSLTQLPCRGMPATADESLRVFAAVDPGNGTLHFIGDGGSLTGLVRFDPATSTCVAEKAPTTSLVPIALTPQRQLLFTEPSDWSICLVVTYDLTANTLTRSWAFGDRIAFAVIAPPKLRTRRVR